MDVGGEQRFVAFFCTLFGRNDDTIAHLGHGGHFRIALVFVPSFFVDLNLYQLALGRFDFDMGHVHVSLPLDAKLRPQRRPTCAWDDYGH